MRFPIAWRLLTLTLLMIVSVVAAVTYTASYFFQKAAKQREESINLDMVTAKAHWLESSLKERMEQLSKKLQKQKSANQTDATKDLIELRKQEPFLIYAALLNPTLQVEQSWLVPGAPEMNWAQWLPHSELSETLLTKDERMKWGVVPSKEPWIFVFFPLFNSASQPHATSEVHGFLWLIFQQDIFKAFFQDQDIREYSLFNHKGQILWSRSALSRESKEDETWLQKALSPQAPMSGQKSQILASGEKVYRAYYRTDLNLVLLSDISESVIMEPVILVRNRVIFIGGLVVAVALILVFIFSLSITLPIEKLAYLMGFIKKGIFDIHALKQVKSIFRDEVTDLAVTIDEMTEGLKERDKVKNLFSKFVAASVSEDLLKNDIALGGSRKEVVVFFSDIRGFTSMSEMIPPEDVVEMLNEYFGVMVKIINESGGVVDKFIGDAIMAVWGVPRPTGQEAERAVRACLNMRLALVELNERRKEQGKNPLFIGMGLNSGSVVAGTIGSQDRMEYTVIGNVVNTASRIEAATKACGTDLLISEEVLQTLPPFFITEMAAEVEVKGRSQALKLYKVKGWRDELTGESHYIQTPYSDFAAEEADKVKLKHEAE